MLERHQAEELIYGHEFAGRFTQDSPILPDVWIRFAERPHERHDLLLTPYVESGAHASSAGRVAQVLRERLGREAEGPVWRSFHGTTSPPRARIAYNQSTVVASLTFDELVRVVLPMSRWWKDRIRKHAYDKELSESTPGKLREALAPAMAYPSAAGSRRGTWASLDLVWMARVIGVLGLAFAKGRIEEGRKRRRSGAKPAEDADSIWPEEVLGTPGRPDEARELAARRLEYYRKVATKVGELFRDLPAMGDGQASIYSVSLNRPATTTVWRSSPAVKGDAAQRVFEISCKDLAWAVIDSGIDARHPAFRGRYPHAERARRVPLPLSPKMSESDPDSPDSPSASIHTDWRRDNEQSAEASDWSDRSRIVGTYDFTVIRHLLAGDEPDDDVPPSIRRRLKAIQKRLTKAGRGDSNVELRQALNSGRELDWSLLEPFLRIPHDDDYEVPNHEHGTHVAGILGSEWRRSDGYDLFPAGGDVVGLCPDIRLYDLRVLDENGQGDEFNVMAALQFVRSLNAHKDYRVVHGVNLSLSIPHDVANYACGRTPVCEECERLVGSGIVVVAAAGNEGYLQYMTAKGPLDGYRSISITDPGNSDGVITVGSTHRDQPHTYGVSYFSSRGPTGDGRAKPDLVAPGEKIEAPIPDREVKRKDGTSMAAPHVSGAAALLIARHRELSGQPKRIKEILCRSATDLGRERYFQGSGMLDVLRALQSV